MVSLREPFFYAGITGVAGAINILSVLILTRNVSYSSDLLDLLYFSLAFLTFVNPVFVGPLAAGLTRYFADLRCDELQSRQICWRFGKEFVGFALVALFPFVFAVAYIIFKNMVELDGAGMYAAVLSAFLTCSCILEVFKSNLILYRQFILTSIGTLSVNLLVFAVVLTGSGIVVYMLVLSLARVAFLLVIIATLYSKNIRSKFALGRSASLFEFYRKYGHYSIATLIVAILNFAPSVVLLGLTSGFVGVFYFALRLALSPVSLLIVPFIDYFRFNYFRSSFDDRRYWSLLVCVSVFVLGYLGLALSFQSEISEYFLKGREEKLLFLELFPIIIFLVVTQGLYVLNTRLSESVVPINTIAKIGLIGHFVVVLGLIPAVLNQEPIFYVYTKVASEILILVPIGFYFVYRSSKHGS